MFEQATRLKLRFPYRGQCSTEDLWDLSVTDLDAIYKALNRQVKEQEGESLLVQKSSEDTVLDLQIEIVKHIVTVKLDEQTKRQDEAHRAARKQRVLEIIADKQDAELRDLPVEKLRELAEELSA